MFENRLLVARSVIRCFCKPLTGGSIGHHVCSRDFCFCVCPCVDRCAPLLCSRCRCCSCSVPLRRSMCLPCAAVARGGLSRDACRAEPRSPHRDAPVALGRQEMGGRPGRAEVAPRWRPGCSRGQKKDSRRGGGRAGPRAQESCSEFSAKPACCGSLGHLFLCVDRCVFFLCVGRCASLLRSRAARGT